MTFVEFCKKQHFSEASLRDPKIEAKVWALYEKYEARNDISNWDLNMRDSLENSQRY